MKSPSQAVKPPANGGLAAPKRSEGGLPRVFSILFGLFFGLALVKFPNPPMAEVWKSNQFIGNFITWPTNGYEWIFSSWPNVIGYGLLAALAVLGIFSARWKIKSPRWLLAMPLVWLGWQFISGTHTLDAQLTGATLKHFTACVVCFYLGAFALSRIQDLTGFCIGLLAGFAWVLAEGLSQHFGGLEETRKQFWLYVYPTRSEMPPEWLKRMSSNRIFSTLFYPNTLAGALLLCLPALLMFVWRLERQFTIGARTLLVALIGLPALACLFWSGSKGGWLLLLLLGLIALLRLKFDRKWKIALIVVILVCGLAGFAVRFSGYFKKGATSVSARFDYWRAAVQTTAANPLFGTGPGTFAIPYRQIKKPEAEMARLTHNDYLEQASDSGLPGFVAYALAIGGVLIWSGRRAMRDGGQFFAVWLGVLAWALQNFVEFGLYIPALSWLAFALLGWLVGSPGNQFDKTKPAA
jgi:hypothetical protein